MYACISVAALNDDRVYGDTSDPRHFGTVCSVPKCLEIFALVPKCPLDISELVPKCLGQFGTKVHETLRTQN